MEIHSLGDSSRLNPLQNIVKSTPKIVVDLLFREHMDSTILSMDSTPDLCVRYCRKRILYDTHAYSVLFVIHLLCSRCCLSKNAFLQNRDCTLIIHAIVMGRRPALTEHYANNFITLIIYGFSGILLEKHHILLIKQTRSIFTD